MSKKSKRLERQQGLLQEFSQEYDHYEEKQMGEHWYVKSWNGGTERWQVSIFTPESFKKYKSFNNKVNEISEQNEHLKNIA